LIYSILLTASDSNGFTGIGLILVRADGACLVLDEDVRGAGCGVIGLIPSGDSDGIEIVGKLCIGTVDRPLVRHLPRMAKPQWKV